MWLMTSRITRTSPPSRLSLGCKLEPQHQKETGAMAQALCVPQDETMHYHWVHSGPYWQVWRWRPRLRIWQRAGMADIEPREAAKHGFSYVCPALPPIQPKTGA